MEWFLRELKEQIFRGKINIEAYKEITGALRSRMSLSLYWSRNFSSCKCKYLDKKMLRALFTIV